ncbi:PrsW family intramembrane metalloprotease [Patescibacteria group bacterium]|nr:PrsW family intramembrane metalloprotease [Patescibacteria group bacterium]
MFLNFIQNYPFILAFILGLIPALLWMWFWLKEDIHPEPAKILTLSFIGGMLAVVFVLPFQKIVYFYFQDQETISFILWAATEELAKFGFVYFIALRNKAVDEPVDDIIYLIVSALGFVTLENTLFLIQPIHLGQVVDTIVHSNLRFMGASLLHVMSSATIGIMLGLSFYKSRGEKILYTVIGIILAIALHSAFNLFIIREVSGNIFFIFGAVWVGIIVLLLLFEKVKHVSNLKSNLP